jgi:Mn2+/Fe2+ NRAMP family transporter
VIPNWNNWEITKEAVESVLRSDYHGDYQVVVVVKFRYRQIETIFKWFALSLFVYGIALVVSQPDWLKLIGQALVPTLYPSKEYWLVLFAMMGTTISPYLFFCLFWL